MGFFYLNIKLIGIYESKQAIFKIITSNLNRMMDSGSEVLPPLKKGDCISLHLIFPIILHLDRVNMSICQYVNMSI